LKYQAYIGTYSVRGSRGIYLIEADSGTGALKILDAWQAESPSYLAISEAGGKKFLYAALECKEFENSPGGGAASFVIGSGGSLTKLSARPTKGRSPCHVCPGPDGKKLFVANYGDGTLSIFNVENGKLSEASVIAHSGQGPNQARQKGPHVHCAQLEPGTGRLCVIDLGIDQAVFYNLKDMSRSGSFATDGGAGPRHVVFSKHSPFAWLVCELSSQVYAFEPKSGKRIGVYSTLPSGFKGESSCAAIKLSPDEKNLYASNRGHDSIACYDIDRKTGALSLRAICPTGGKNPRDFAISPDGAFLYAANQDSDNIKVFKLEKGLPVETGQSLDIPAPVCVVIS